MPMTHRIRTFLALTLLSASATFADGTVGLVSDLRTSPDRLVALDPFGFVPLDDERLVFVADHPDLGPELWITNGTPEGTDLVAETVPGNPGLHGSGVRGTPVRLGDKVYFRSCDARRVCQVWETDGTSAGTRSITRFSRPEPPGTWEIEALGDTLYFVGSDAESGSELWASDGSLDGTGIVADLAPGIEDSYISDIGVAAGRVFAIDGFRDELWASDGTELGTHRILDLGHSAISSQILAAGDRVYVSGLARLWISDGTPEGTRLVFEEVIDVVGLLGESLVYVLVDFRPGGVDRSLWITDGTPSGTRLLREGLPDRTEPGTQIGGVLYFGVDSELWSTDGTVAGTRVLAAVDHRVQSVGAVGSGLLVATPASLWRFDGEEVAPVSTELGGSGLTPLGEGLVFATRSQEDGNELGFAMDDTVTILAELVDPGSTAPVSLVGRADDLYFVTSQGEGEVFESGGTSGTTRSLGPTEIPSVLELAASGVAAFGDVIRGVEEGLPILHDPGSDTIVFRDSVLATPSSAVVQIWNLLLGRVELWGTDGTEAGTGMLAVLGDLGYCGVCSPPSPPPIYGGDADALGAVVYFEDRLFRTDGTESRTTELWDVGAGCPECRLGGVAVADDTVYFIVTESYRPASLWAIDRAGTDLRELLEFAGAHVGRTLPDPEMTAVGSGLYFTLESPTLGEELWWTDGTGGGTRPVADLRPGSGSSSPRDLTVFRGRLYFSADDGDHGRELWVSIDGTEAGTGLVADVRPGPESSSPTELVSLGDRLAFVADDGVHGLELWEMDGSTAGTRLVADIEPGRFPSVPSELTPVGGRVDFAATTSDRGRELWSWSPGLLPCPSCVLDGRFDVSVAWEHGGESGAGVPVPFSNEAVSFWFFGSENVEVVVKVLDGRGINGHFWVFLGGLTSVVHEVRIEDRLTGEVRTYRQEGGDLCSRFDTEAFASPPGGGSGPPASPPVPRRDGCDIASGTLCLQGSRFALDVAWTNQHDGGTSGVGLPIPATRETGYFSFFGPGRIELMVKVLDGRPINGRWWVFHPVLTDLEVRLRVEDLETGTVEEYVKPAGGVCGTADTDFGS